VPPFDEQDVRIVRCALLLYAQKLEKELKDARDPTELSVLSPLLAGARAILEKLMS
jgi:hypothetical protein